MEGNTLGEAKVLWHLGMTCTGFEVFRQKLNHAELSADQIGKVIGKLDQLADAVDEVLETLTMSLNQQVRADIEAALKEE